MEFIVKKLLCMNILIPLDDSTYCEKALLHICNMIKNYQSSLILMFVVEKPILVNLLNKK